jgi:serine/threonine protein phosphatase 1
MSFRFFGGKARPAPTGPVGTRLYAIGDIHGRADLLQQMTGLIREDAARHAAARNVVICLGDYVDRGPDSRAVIDLLRAAPLPGFEQVLLRGNHEDFMLHFLTDASVGWPWLANGGRETLESYGIDPPSAQAGPDALERAQRALAERLPVEHIAFLQGLKPLHEEGDFCFVHAGVKPGVALAKQREHDLLWIRDEFLTSHADFGRIIVHGHSITPVPDVRPNRIGIDTGAYMSGRLTCLVIEGTERAFLQT